MPTVLREGPYRVFFYSADCSEPAHVHIRRDDALVKLWLHDIAVADNVSYPAHELAKLIALVRAHRETLLEAWHEHCSRP